MLLFKQFLVILFLNILVFSYFTNDHIDHAQTSKQKLKKAGFMMGCKYSETVNFRRINGLKPKSKDMRTIIEKCKELYSDRQERGF